MSPQCKSEAQSPSNAELSNQIEGKLSISPQISNTTTLVGDARLAGGALDALVPHDRFEGKHLYDPQTTWTAEEEAKVRLKTDVRLLGWFCLMYFGMQLDRGNLSNALTDNFLQNLGFTTTEYGNGVMLQRICFLVAQLPSQIFVMRFGFRFALPALVSAWGTVGAFAPVTLLCFSNFYKNTEMSLRLAILGSGLTISRILSSLLAAGILQMRGVANKPGWFWLFIIDGLITFWIGLASFFYLPVSPVRTQTVLRRKQWYTEREQVILINRLLRDDPSKGQTATETNISLRDIFATIRDPSMAGLFLVGLIGFIPASPVHQYLTLNLRHLGFSTFESNMLTIPAEIIHVITMLALAWSSERFNERTFHCVFGILWILPLLATLLALPGHSYHWARYTIVVLIVGAPNCYPIVLNWISRNSFDVKKRGLSVVIFGTLDMVGSVASAQIYWNNDRPYYYTGNKVLITIGGASVLALLAQREWLKYLNRKRNRVWEKMTDAEQKDYKENKGVSAGNEGLAFSFSY